MDCELTFLHKYTVFLNVFILFTKSPYKNNFNLKI